EVGYELARVLDLAQFANRATMILEVKRAKWEDVLLSRIGDLPTIIVASFDHSMVAELARRNAPFPLGLTIFGRIVDCASYAKTLGASWLFPQFRFVDRELVESMHANGIRVVPWTANRDRDWQ